MNENQNMECCPGAHKGPVKAILIIAAVMLIVYLAVLTRNAWRAYDYIGRTPDIQDRITVTGTAKINAVPDVASINLGIISEGATVNAAQKGVTEKMNAIIDSLKKEFKIDAKDIKTENFSVSPKYDWSEGRQRIIGYQANQSVSVKIRDFDKTGDILAKTTDLGANQVSGPNFIIDDLEKVKAQAREEAIKQAKAKAKTLADQVGIKLGRIVNFYEGDGEITVAPYGRDMALGVAEMKSVAPVVEPGSQDVQLTVSLSYEIK